MGFKMIKVIQDVRLIIKNDDLNMRIGVHTVKRNIHYFEGNIIGGIIGTDIIRYDIYGSNVVIANKMESNGVPGCITVSEDTKNLIESCNLEKFTFQPHKLVEIKATKSSIQSYIISTFSETDL